MSYRGSTWAFVLAATLNGTLGAKAADDGKYPDWRGQWEFVRVPGVGARMNPGFDPTKPWGPGQQAPLTAEYQKVLEDSMADQANWVTTRPRDACRAACRR